MLEAKVRHLRVVGMHRSPFRVLLPVPRERSPAVGIALAFERDLVAVVDRRGADIGHLEQRGERQATDVAVRLRQVTHGVMTVDQVHLDGDGLARVGQPTRCERGIELGRRALRVAQELQHWITEEGVVHDRVVDPRLHVVGGVAPQFAHDVRVGLDLLHALVEQLPEPERDLVRYVQSHAVDVRVLEPVLRGVEQILDQPHVRLGVLHVTDRHFGLAVAGQVEVQVGQVAEVPPAVVVVARLPRPADVRPAGGQRILLELEPRVVGRGWTLLDRVLECPVRVTAVVEHDVEDDADALRLGLFDERDELLVGAEVRIDLAVVRGVVLVRRLRLEDRIEVDDGDAE